MKCLGGHAPQLRRSGAAMSNSRQARRGLASSGSGSVGAGRPLPVHACALGLRTIGLCWGGKGLDPGGHDADSPAKSDGLDWWSPRVPGEMGCRPGESGRTPQPRTLPERGFPGDRRGGGAPPCQPRCSTSRVLACLPKSVSQPSAEPPKPPSGPPPGTASTGPSLASSPASSPPASRTAKGTGNPSLLGDSRALCRAARFPP